MRCTLTALLLLSLASAARADIIVPSNADITGVGGGPGLTGTYYHEGAGSTRFDVGTTVALQKSSTPTGTFTSTAVNYSGSDMSTITGFLGNDASSYRGPTPAAFDLSDAILDLKGYFYVPTAGTIAFTSGHDDALQFSVAGQVAISSSLGNSSTNVTFSAPGYYAIDLIYGNTEYNNGTGNAGVTLFANGALVTSANVFQTVVPEPATLVLLGSAILGLITLSRHRRRTRLGRGSTV